MAHTITSNKLITARKEAHLTQKQAAFRLQCSSTSLWKYEQGDTSPTAEFLFRAAKVYGRTASWFLETDKAVDWHHLIGSLSSSDVQTVKNFIDFLNFRRVTSRRSA